MKLQSMSRAQTLSRTLAAAAFAAHCLPALAEDKSASNTGSPAAHAAAGGPATMALAWDLYALGIRESDALTVLAAAKLAASVDVVASQPVALDPATVTFDGFDQGPLAGRKLPIPTDRKAPEPLTAGAIRPAAKVMLLGAPSTEDATSPVSAEAMLVAAVELAGDDAILLGLIEEARAEGPGDRIGNTVSWPSQLPSGGTDLWAIPFFGNLDAEIAVIGGGDTNLDVAVTDASGGLICLDAGWPATIHCNWAPVSDGHVYVTVQNAGKGSAGYLLVTN